MDMFQLTVIASLSLVLLAFVVVLLVRRRARRNKLLVVTTRIIACVLVQLIAIFAVTSIMKVPDEEIGYQNLNQLFESNAADFILMSIIVLADIFLIIIIALFKSSWVEPLVP